MDTPKARLRSWHRIACVVPEAQVEDLSAACFELGSCGLETREEGDAVQLVSYYPDSLDAHAVQAALVARLRTAGLTGSLADLDRLPEQDWEAEWRRFFRPVWATRDIVVHPSWEPVKVGPGQIAIVIDPQMAFGTGEHESTRLCLRGLVESLSRGDRCLDLGTGSGVLTIAAWRLGAGHVTALDVDPLAVANALANLDLNGVAAGAARVLEGSLECVAGDRFDLILANIQSSVLTPLLVPLCGLLTDGGRVLFGGLLDGERDRFAQCVAESGLCVDRVESLNEWCCVAARRRA